MGQELQLPDWAKGKQVAQAFAGLNAHDDNLSDGIGQSYGVIGYKGKVWSLRVRGERHNILHPTEGTPSAYLDVIILGQARTKSKSFYKKYDANTSDGDRPLCSSIDGIVPDADVTQKQSDSCALCQKNVWKTDPQTGRKGRECTDYKRLAVLVLPTQTAPILGSALMEPVFLRVPPDSLNSLAIMGEGMANQGFHFSSYITRITFDPNKAHPCMNFRPLQGLTDGEAPVILDLRNDATVGRITGGESTAGPKLVPVETASTGLVALPSANGQTANGATPAAPSPAAAGSQPLPPAAPTLTLVSGTLATSSNGLGGAPPATPPTPAAAPSTLPTTTTSTGLVDTGFGGATSASQPGVSAQTQQVAPADAGEPEESDAALDARIASMIRK